MILNNLNIILLLTPILISVSIWCYFYCSRIPIEGESILRKLELKLKHERDLKKTLDLKENEIKVLENKTNKQLAYLKIDIFNLSFSLEEILVFIW